MIFKICNITSANVASQQLNNNPQNSSEFRVGCAELKVPNSELSQHTTQYPTILCNIL